MASGRVPNMGMMLCVGDPESPGFARMMDIRGARAPMSPPGAGATSPNGPPVTALRRGSAPGRLPVPVKLPLSGRCPQAG